ncbi:MAG: hypothetical protein A3C04_01810 [Candidatus Wildermuthbacteria bacterium RIFCSPHIGHO2_02_FULL_45_25]|uniref:Macrocin O-methyltransferase n=1 Tax=Candidatus Wildermuthbacteria bacterium RIFCSPHIGHO2_02_FULL_45_25 TaxID=1802450 RepID=A0A1G2R5J5_9BACT|nr:MAG: hypothetical protein A3C04_01810 [Candidatus Wildermuthbacteria bacterium RIFCSPHIGHO2_02_FULL_45_25]
MGSYERLENAFELARNIERERKEGAFVECGVWKGGCIGAMASVAHQADSHRHIWLFDSFEGLPEPSSQDGSVAERYSKGKALGALRSIQKCVGPLQDVNKLFFSILGLKKEYIHIEKGWLQHTLPLAKKNIGSIAILRIDVDWYESTKCVLDLLYDQVVPGGYVIIDDYGHWEGCKKAVDEFMQKRSIRVPLQWIDYTGVYFVK